MAYGDVEIFDKPSMYNDSNTDGDQWMSEHLITSD